MERDLFTRCVSKVRFYLAPHWRGTREALRKHVRKLLLPFRENRNLLADLIRTPAKIMAVAGLAWAVNGEMTAPAPEAGTSSVARVVAGDPVQEARSKTHPGEQTFAPAAGPKEDPNLGSAGGSRALVFIDESLPISVREGVQPGVEVHIVRTERSGIEQISEVLAGRKNITSINIMGGGSDDCLLLGTDSITDENREYYAAAFSSWRQAISTDADIRLQGVDRAPMADLDEAAESNQDEELIDSAIAAAGFTGPQFAADEFASMVSGASNEDLWTMATATVDADPLGLSPVAATRGVSPRANFSPTTVGELITAITTANGNGEADVIDLGGNTFTLAAKNNTYKGYNGLPQIQSDGGNALTIKNGTIERDGAAGNFRLFFVHENADFTLDGVTLQNGRVNGGGSGTEGGAIYCEGKLTIQNGSVITGNTAISRGGAILCERDTLTIDGSTISNSKGNTGAGIYARTDGYSMSVTVSNSTISGNSTYSDSGGGIAARNDTVLSITDTKFANNSATGNGGAIHCNTSVDLDVTGSTFDGNSAGTDGGGIWSSSTVAINIGTSTLSSNKAPYGEGGGIYCASKAGVTITDSTLSDNTARDDGGAIFNQSYGTISISTSTLSGNTVTSGPGGAIAHYVGGAGGSLTIVQSTLSGNSASSEGGAIYCEGNLVVDIENSTLSGNTAGTTGGGIQLHDNPTLDLFNSTIAGNTAPNGGGGIHLGGTSCDIRNLQSSIVADNDSGANPDDIQITGTNKIVLGNTSKSLVEDATGGHGITAGYNGCVIGQDPMLGPLQDNGGSTFTQALLNNSPAINTGDNPRTLATDQRGVTRVINAIADMGAYEVGNTQPAATNLDQAHNYPVNAASVPIDDIVVTDPDAAEQITATLRLNNPNTGALSADSGNGETFNTSSGVWTITATVAEVNAALAAVAFIPATDNQIATTVSIQIEDGLEDGSQPVLGEIFLNAAPLIINAGASPNPVAAQAETMLTVEATDGPGEDLTYAWDFGDGANGTGETTTHAYGVVGTYTVTVTVTDQHGASTAYSFDVTVIPAESVAGVGPDSDGDGFSDSLETFVGSDPLSFDSTPFDIPPLGTPEWALVKKLRVKLNFKPGQTGKDRIWLIGELRIPPGFSFAGRELVVDISGVQHRMTLDERGRGQDGTVKFRLNGNVYKMTRGFIGDYQATLAEFADLDNLNIFREPRVIRVTLLFDDKAHVRNLVVRYRGFKDRKGVAVKTGRESPVTP